MLTKRRALAAEERASRTDEREHTAASPNWGKYYDNFGTTREGLQQAAGEGEGDEWAELRRLETGRRR